MFLLDSNGATVVQPFFTSRYHNPRLLHRGTLQRIMQEFRKITKNVINFEEDNPPIIESEWNKIINAELDKDNCDLIYNEYLEKNKSPCKKYY